MSTVNAATADQHEIETTEKVVEGTAGIEVLAGIAAVALPVLAIAHVLPVFLAAIATIIIGVTFMVEGGGLAARYSTLLSRVSGRVQSSELTGGMTVDLLGGLTGTALGILALVGGGGAGEAMPTWTSQLNPLMLMGVAVLIFAATLVVGAGATAQLNALPTGMQRGVARRAVNAAAGAQVVLGVGAAVLGIISLAGISAGVAATLIAVALLGIGGSLFLTGTAVGGRMVSMLHRGA